MIAPEIIGPPECPILHRWTLFGEDERDEAGELVKRKALKLLVHHFLPNADDRDTHDHPRPFWTFVLAGGYDDLVPCEDCEGAGWHRGGGFGYDDAGNITLTYSTVDPCASCNETGVKVGDRLRRGALRRRAATYAHRTRVGPQGCWTIVLMGPWRRDWGFWRGGMWWARENYERRFGFGMRCE